MQPLWKTVWNFLRKLKMELPFDPEIPLLGLYPKNPETPIQKNICTPVFIAAQFTITTCWKQPKCPSVTEWIKKDMVHLHNGILCRRENEGVLPFVAARMELESIMLSEISQVVKDKYHMISPLTGTQSTKQTSKQNITKDIEIENRPTVTRGEGIIEEKGEGFAGKSIKGLWTITRRVVGGVGGKGRKLYLNINKKMFTK